MSRNQAKMPKPSQADASLTAVPIDQPESELLPATLQDSLAFNLRLAQAASFAAFARQAEAHGLKPGDYAVMRLIYESPGIMPSQISVASGRDKSTLTPHLTNLERRGLIVRTRSETDRRAQHIALTDTGISLLERLTGPAEMHDARIEALLSPNEKDQILSILRRIWRNIN